MSHRGYIIENGRIVREGPSSELLHDDQIQASYLGI
jgi:ABC-type branched-subunit amino acid transport system ATPase component